MIPHVVYLVLEPLLLCVESPEFVDGPKHERVLRLVELVGVHHLLSIDWQKLFEFFHDG